MIKLQQAKYISFLYCRMAFYNSATLQRCMCILNSPLSAHIVSPKLVHFACKVLQCLIITLLCTAD